MAEASKSRDHSSQRVQESGVREGREILTEALSGDNQQRGRPNGNSPIPLRMVVNARLIGAIIGEGGFNIRQLSQETKTRCSVDENNSHDHLGHLEKVININGSPANCSKACLKILEMIKQIVTRNLASQGIQNREVKLELKLRTHNNLVGRLIGRSGMTLKKLMDDTHCSIFVSNIDMPAPQHMERTIVIRGQLENIAKAEEIISDKLRQWWENDMVNASIRMLCNTNPWTPPAIGDSQLDPEEFPPLLPDSNPNPGRRSRSTNSHSHSEAAAPVQAQRRASENDSLGLDRPSTTPAPVTCPKTLPKPNTSKPTPATTPKPPRFATSSPVPTTPKPVVSQHPPMHPKMPVSVTLPMAAMKPTASVIPKSGISPPKAAPLKPVATELASKPISQIAASSKITTSALRSALQAVDPGSPIPKNSTPKPAVSAAKPSPVAKSAPIPNESTPEIPVSPLIMKPPTGPPEMVYIWIPNSSLWPLVGSEGTDVRNLISQTGAMISIESAGMTGIDAGPRKQPMYSRRDKKAERCVTIIGDAVQQYKAQHFVHQRVCESEHHLLEDVRLRLEIELPPDIFGYIIGKTGRKISRLQEASAAQIDLVIAESENDEEYTAVKIMGNFFQAQALQACIRHLAFKFQTKKNAAPSTSRQPMEHAS